MRWALVLTTVAGVAGVGCAGADPADHDRDLAESIADLGALVDLHSFPDLACALGTPDHCGDCATKCPGLDDSTTARRCTDTTTSGKCELTCKADHYDVDGDVANGCETVDPLQSDAASAKSVTLADAAVTNMACSGTVNGCSVSAAVASDARKHELAPVDRPIGVDDWWKVIAVGTGGAGTMKACLSISNVDWPMDNKYEVCISAQGSMSPTVCMQAVARMSGVCVLPTGNTDAGTYYVRVRKVIGQPTSLGYALYLEH
jgi:hypothetical protein